MDYTNPAWEGWHRLQPWVAALAAISVILDWWWLRAKRLASSKQLQQQATSHGWNFLIAESLRAVRLPWLWFLLDSLHRPTFVGHWPSVVQFALAYILVDFVLYWWHRALHESSLGWASHSVHHTASLFELSLGARINVLQRVLDDVIYLPLALFGLSPGWILVAIEINRLAQFWTHTEHIGPLPLLDAWLNTPATHRVHHALLPGGARKNFGSNFMLWDHLFGTYQAPDGVRVYGVTDLSSQGSFLETQIQGFRALWKRRWQRSRIESALALVYSLFIFAWFVSYAAHYEGDIFLWVCSVVNVFMLFAVWADDGKLLSVSALLALGVDAVYAFDLSVRLLSGHFPLGVTAYVFESSRPFWLRSVSLCHVWMPALMLWLLSRRRYWAGAWKAALPVSAGILALSHLAARNVNFVNEFNDLPHLSAVSAWVFMAGVFIFPTHRVLSFFFSQRVAS